MGGSSAQRCAVKPIHSNFNKVVKSSSLVLQCIFFWVICDVWNHAYPRRAMYPYIAVLLKLQFANVAGLEWVPLWKPLFWKACHGKGHLLTLACGVSSIRSSAQECNWRWSSTQAAWEDILKSTNKNMRPLFLPKYLHLWYRSLRVFTRVVMRTAHTLITTQFETVT